jgi:hypothetical protein
MYVRVVVAWPWHQIARVLHLVEVVDFGLRFHFLACQLLQLRIDFFLGLAQVVLPWGWKLLLFGVLNDFVQVCFFLAHIPQTFR